MPKHTHTCKTGSAEYQNKLSSRDILKREILKTETMTRCSLGHCDADTLNTMSHVTIMNE